MTTPGQSLPPTLETLLGIGAFQIGGGSTNFGQGINEAFVRNLIAGAGTAIWTGIENVGQIIDNIAAWLATLPLEALKMFQHFIPGSVPDQFIDIATAVQTIVSALSVQKLLLSLDVFEDFILNTFNLLGTIVSQIISIIKGDPVTPITEDVQFVKTWFANFRAVFEGIDWSDPFLDPANAITWLQNEIIQPLLDVFGLGGITELGSYLYDTLTELGGGLGSIVASFSDLLNNLVDGLTGTTGSTLQTPEGVLTAAQTLFTNFGNLSTNFNLLLNYLYDAFTGAVGSTGKALSDVLSAAQTFYTGASGAATKIATLISDLGGSVIGDVSGIIGSLVTGVADILNTLWNIFTGNTGATGKTLANVAAAGSSFFTTVAGVVSDFQILLNNLFDAFNVTTGSTGKTLANVFTAAQTFLGNVINQLVNMTSGGLYNAAAGFNNVSTSLLKHLTPTGGNIGQFDAAYIAGTLNNAVQIGSTAISSIFNGSGQFIGVLNSATTGALGTAVTLGGTALGTLSTSWNGAVTNISNLLSGSGLATTTLVGSNLAQIGTAITNAAAGTLGTLGAVATQVQTGFSNLISGLFGGLTGTPSAATYSQAQVETAAQAVVTNAIGNAATFVGLQNDSASNAALMSYAIKFGDYGSGTFSLPAAFTLSNDNSYYAGTNGSIEIVNGRAVYKKSGTGTSQKIARYNVAPTTTDYQEVSWVHTGNQESSPHLTAIYARMNSAATSYLKFELQNGNSLNMIAVVAGSPTSVGGVTNNLKPGARYTIKMGQLGGLADIRFYENDVLIKSFSDSVHQKGASYRYAGFGFSGDNTGTQPNNFGIDVFSVADQVFKPGPAATAYVSTSETRALTSYGDLATTTDQVTVTVGSSGMVELCLSSFMSLSGSAGMWATFEASGANTIAASDIYAIEYTSPGAGYEDRKGATYIIPNLNPGSTTFKMKYRVNAGTGTWKDRRIAAIPL